MLMGFPYSKPMSVPVRKPVLAAVAGYLLVAGSIGLAWTKTAGIQGIDTNFGYDGTFQLASWFSSGFPFDLVIIAVLALCGLVASTWSIRSSTAVLLTVSLYCSMALLLVSLLEVRFIYEENRQAELDLIWPTWGASLFAVGTSLSAGFSVLAMGHAGDLEPGRHSAAVLPMKMVAIAVGCAFVIPVSDYLELASLTQGPGLVGSESALPFSLQAAALVIIHWLLADRLTSWSIAAYLSLCAASIALALFYLGVDVPGLLACGPIS